MLQSTGISALRPNTYCMNFPTLETNRDYSFFFAAMRHAQSYRVFKTTSIQFLEPSITLI